MLAAVSLLFLDRMNDAHFDREESQPRIVGQDPLHADLGSSLLPAC